MDFDEIIDRRNTHSIKWDGMQKLYGVSPDDGIPMWVADMDFRPPQCVTNALKAYLDGGVFGYFGNDEEYLAAICWWMKTRHGWAVEPDWISTAHGLVNGTALCIDTFSNPGDGIALFSPVYHAFYRIINGSDRVPVELPLVNRDGRYEMDFDAYDALMTGNERVLLLCSPHNPGGRVWTRAELKGVAEFARRHNLILVSDEVHHDLIMPGFNHIHMGTIDADVQDRLIILSATTKTFNIAGAHLGNIIIPDPDLRAAVKKRMLGLGISPNAFGLHMITAAYSAEGATWVDALTQYLDGNRQVMEAALNAIPGVQAMRLEGTYLEWADFENTGLTHAEIKTRLTRDAGIAASDGPTFGTGGEHFMRFNIATPRARITEAAERLARAFSDLQ